MGPRLSSLPNSRERHALQVLLSGNWKPAAELYPASKMTRKRLAEKGWIEQRRLSREVECRITEAGREAFRAKLPGK